MPWGDSYRVTYFNGRTEMNNYTRVLIAVGFALITSAFSCSQKDEPVAEIDAAVKSGTEMAEEGNQAMKEADGLGEKAMSGAGDLSDKAMIEADKAAKTAMDQTEGEVANLVDQVEGMASDGLADVEGMTEEELKKKAKEKAMEKLGVSE